MVSPAVAPPSTTSDPAAARARLSVSTRDAELARHPDRALAEAQARMRRGDFTSARQLLIEAERRHPQDGRFAPLIERACDRDPDYAPPLARLQPDQDITAIKRLGGGSSITLKLLKGDDIVGVLKPAQKGSPGGYRGEIASWRLCPLIRCGFHIAYNRLVALRHPDFVMLYGRIESEKQQRYAKRFGDLTLRDDAGEKWVYGALEDWVKEFAALPIERTDSWSSWVRQPADGGLPLAQLNEPAAAAFSVEDTRGHAGMHRLLMRHLRGTSRRQLARQLSSVLAFDFLTSNWDRFSTSEKLAGANCQIRHGTIVSIDNGAAFPFYPQKTPGQRLKLVQRFSRQLVRAVERLDHDATRKRLFGRISRSDKRRFKLFWSQRRTFLDYIAELTAKYGEDAVLAFD